MSDIKILDVILGGIVSKSPYASAVIPFARFALACIVASVGVFYTESNSYIEPSYFKYWLFALGAAAILICVGAFIWFLKNDPDFFRSGKHSIELATLQKGGLVTGSGEPEKQPK